MDSRIIDRLNRTRPPGSQNTTNRRPYFNLGHANKELTEGHAAIDAALASAGIKTICVNGADVPIEDVPFSEKIAALANSSAPHRAVLSNLANPISTAAPKASPAGKIPTSVLLQAANAVLPGNGLWQLPKDSAEQRAALVHFFHVRHLNFPGIESEVAALPPDKQRQPKTKLEGLERMSRASSQRTVDEILKSD